MKPEDSRAERSEGPSASEDDDSDSDSDWEL